MKLLVLIMLMSIVCYELKGQTKFKAESGVGISIVDYPGPAKNTYNDAETLSYFEVKPMIKYDVGFSLEVTISPTGNIINKNNAISQLNYYHYIYK